MGYVVVAFWRVDELGVDLILLRDEMVAGWDGRGLGWSRVGGVEEGGVGRVSWGGCPFGRDGWVYGLPRGFWE